MRIKQATVLIYITTLLAVIQSVYLHIITTDYAHIILSTHFIIEAVILAVTIFIGLRRKQSRFILGILTLTEVVLFYHERPVSPDELPMIIIFVIRVYVFILLFGKTVNQYYKSVN